MRTTVLFLFIMLFFGVSHAGGEKMRAIAIPDPMELQGHIERALESGDNLVAESLIHQFTEQFPGESWRLDRPAVVSLQGEYPVERKSLPLSTELMQFGVVPPSYAGTPGTATFLGPLANGQRTYQLLIHESLLTDFIGRDLKALSWRIPASATGSWPAAEVMYTNFDIYLSASVTPASRSLTFADNVAGPQTQVLNGGLEVATGSYASGSSPNEWGPEITFTPYPYAGGHLLVEVRHTGFTGTSRSLDAIGTSTSGYGTLFSGAWQSNYAATTGLQGNFCVTRFTSSDSISVTVGEDSQMPELFTLRQNYPNPFNPSTTIEYELPSSSFVSLTVHNTLGQEVATLVNGMRNPGSHSVLWDADGYASGVYFYQITAGSFREIRRMVLMR